MDKLTKILLEAARKNVPSDQVPVAFEQRIMARLPDRSDGEMTLSLSQLFIRAAWIGLALSALIAVANLFPTNVDEPDAGFSLDTSIVAGEDSGEVL